jgi:hypothetical protein
MDVAVVFSMSERFRNNLGKNSDSSGRMLYSREKWIGLDYIASENVIGRAVRLSCRPGLQPTGIRPGLSVSGDRFNFDPASGRV